MSTMKGSSDFGLYRDSKGDKLRGLSVKIFVVISGVVVIFLTIILTLITITTKEVIEIEEQETDHLTKPAPLLALNPTKLPDFRKLPPSPFGNNFQGPPPTEFHPSTERTMTLNYPQLTAYRNKYYPKNIQDIIGYVSTTLPRSVRKEKQDPPKLGGAFSNNDPFYSYKPQDPGDINLLATAAFRFAPPIWKSVNKNAPKIYSSSIQNQQIKDTSIKKEVFNKMMVKPLVVTLNIYPMESDFPFTGLNRYGQKQNFPYKFVGNGINSVGSKNKMTIHLNVYPDPSLFEEQNYDETKMFKDDVNV